MIFLFALLALGAARPAKSAGPRVRIDVTVVEDDRFAALPPERVEAMLGSAKQTFVQRFGAPSLQMDASKRVSMRAFFSSLPAEDFAQCLNRHESRRADALSDYDRPRLTESVASFLSRWRMAALLPAFPPELRPTLRTHEDAARAVVAEMRAAAQKAFSATFADGALALQSDAQGRRFVDWLCAFEVQRDTDVVLTNAYVFYDLMTEPYPHAVYHGSRLAGAVMQSPYRDALFGRGVFVSSFGFEGEPRVLLEPGYAELAPTQRDAFIGTYLLAHELGHALLRIPDLYDHGPKCLMTTDYAQSYVDGFRRLLDNPGRCTRCAPYVDARKLVQRMDELLRRKRLPPAEQMADRAIQRLPKNLDGSTGDYAARVLTRLASAELDAFRYHKADVYARRALLADPLHTPARVVLKKAQQRLNLPASR